ncbi:unnamed protein product [Phytophthora fragariaefolia]|uniref:Unnamed protein product n=1 Tax=Phytophthora fragariaefolia TaxID=1490495 RepID=A0A9W6X2Z0_9STRA|nr:unnamed protein product [Phytophthora fragariaefolia]
MMELDLLPGGSRGYWKYHAPGKWFKQAKVVGKINNEKATLLFDSGAEVSIIDTAFARKVTLAGSLVCYFDAWAGAQSGQNAIPGMDFMVPAGIRLDPADGSLCLPDEVKIQLSGRRQLYSANSQLVTLDQHLEVPEAEVIEVPIRSGPSPHSKLWVTRGPSWDATIDLQQAPKETEQPADPMVERPQYLTPTKIARRPVPNPKPVVSAIARRDVLSTGKPPEIVKDERLHDRDTGPPTEMLGEPATPSIQSEQLIDMALKRDPTVAALEPPVTLKSEVAEEEQICYHEGGYLFVEDVEQHMALLPEVISSTDEVMVEDTQAGDPEFNTPEEIDHLRRIIWRRKHFLIGKGNALPPAALGAVCDIDVGGAAPMAQRVRPVAPQFREKLSQLIKGLLSAKIIQPSTSPWPSPIVIIIKKNGVDIRLCIDYRLVNSLTRLMVYPMPLINDLLEDLDKVLWYCSLDMASDFWVWLRMPFGLKNAPQLYQRLVDNALYGHLKIRVNSDSALPIDVFKDGEAETDQKPSILGRRSYIDDILVTASDWDVLCEKVENLLEACDRWNLSISVVKSFWGPRKVDYLGHRVSADGLEADPKDLESLANLPFPRTLRSMQSFLGSLNY